MSKAPVEDVVPGWHAIPFVGLLLILPFPGTVAMRLLSLAAATAIALWWWRRLSPPPVPAKAAFLFWAVVAMVSLTYAADPAYSLNEIKNEVGYSMMAFLAFFAATRDERRLQWWMLAVVVSAVAVSVWALVVRSQLGYWDDGRGHGGVGNFASLAVAVMPMTAVAWTLASRRWQRTFLALAALVILAAAYYSRQRILWVALGVELVLALVLLQWAGRLRLSRTALVIAAVAIVAAAGALLSSAHESRLRAGDKIDASIDRDARLAHWSRIVSRIAEHPMTGAGFGREAMKRAYPDLIPDKPPLTMLWHPHNMFLTYGVGMGFPGIVALLALFVALGAAYWRHRAANHAVAHMAAVAGLAMLAGIVTRNMTNDFFLRDGALLFWSLNGALMGYLARGKSPRSLSEQG